jgi:hypothetical protein
MCLAYYRLCYEISSLKRPLSAFDSLPKSFFMHKGQNCHLHQVGSANCVFPVYCATNSSNFCMDEIWSISQFSKICFYLGDIGQSLSSIFPEILYSVFASHLTNSDLSWIYSKN